MGKTNYVFNRFYYSIKPFLPRNLQIYVRSKVAKVKRKKKSSCWPILDSAMKPPKDWKGWPDQKRIAVVLTHDVESRRGLEKCTQLMNAEIKLGYRSCFNFVVKRYQVPDSLRDELENMGFEVGIHGVYHDGKLFQSMKIFKQRAKIINSYLKNWHSVGFRSPAMHCNLEWLHKLKISYDMSTFDTDPFEPQSVGVGTIFPFWVKRDTCIERFLELPYTVAQDFTLFILLNEKTTNLWRKKIDWVFKHGGMVLINTHPDYMAFDDFQNSIETYPVELYFDILNYIKVKYRDHYWNSVPKEVFKFYSTLSIAD